MKVYLASLPKLVLDSEKSNSKNNKNREVAENNMTENNITKLGSSEKYKSSFVLLGNSSRN